MKREIEQLREYILSERPEKATDHLVFPIFRKIFGKRFKRETEAENADIYIEGQLAVELKARYEDWQSGFFQALHYEKKGLAFSAICIIAHAFIGLWKLNDIPTFALEIAKKTNPQKSASEAGIINARKTNKGQKAEIIKNATICVRPYDKDSIFGDDLEIPLSEFVDALKNLDSVRRQINPQNFIQKIEHMKSFFDDPMEAVHCFYTILKFWDTTAIVPEPPPSDASYLFIISKNSKTTTTKTSERFKVNPRKQHDFRKFIESHYVFTNEGSGLTVDYYFSRFDEVISKLKPEYTRQHGIIFTDHNLSKFALWFVHHYYEKKLSDKYIVLDPAGGSGNLVTSWRGHLKHKIVSELQPELLKIIERRMKADPEHIEMGFTIVPKTTRNKGLNFLDKPASKYLNHLKKELKEKNLKIDKPIAFLLNPPYKSTDEPLSIRQKTGADYNIDKSIVELTGKDAEKERFLAFLGQIVNISKIQVKDNPDFEPIIMVFTPTAWLIPRPSYTKFRKEFDKYFKYEKGFIITGNEFFKIGGKFPISFTIWRFNYKPAGNKNAIKVRDFTSLVNEDLQLNWNSSLDDLNRNIRNIIRGSKSVLFSQIKPTIKEWCGQKMYDFKRSRTKKELSQDVVGGLPLKAPERDNIKTYGVVNSKYIGFMGDCTPVRVRQVNENRFSLDYEKRVWFRLDNDFKSLNRTRIINGPTDKYAYCAYNLDSAKKIFTWFALTKALNGRYPIFFNQHDIWKPNIKKELEKYFYSLCFSYGLAVNRCVVTKFEKDNPVEGAPEIFVDNPLCPTNIDSFWSKILDSEIVKNPPMAIELVNAVKKLYQVWGHNYCKGDKLEYVGLDDEPYFKYFDYPDFLTTYSGLVQIRKFAEVRRSDDLHELLQEIKERTKIVLDKIYRILIEEFEYFKP